jgi:monoterpene epsilon-lactone hydrolase
MSIQLFLADKLIRLTAKRRFARNPDVLQLRPMMAEMRPPPVPARIALQKISLGGVPAERLAPKTADAKRAMLYIHGGGFVGGSPSNHRALTWRLAEQLGCTVFAIDYRLAPEHPFPAGLEDCATAYRELLNSGYQPEALAVGGDSAGGNLTLALALKLKALDLPQPAALVTISPATDLAGSLPSHNANARADAMFDVKMFGSLTPLYCPGQDPTNPLISPLRGDTRGFAPTLIQCSRDEMLRDDGVMMAENLKAAGVDVKLEVWPRVFHAWPVMADIVPEARRAIENIVRFVAERWSDSNETIRRDDALATALSG